VSDEKPKEEPATGTHTSHEGIQARGRKAAQALNAKGARLNLFLLRAEKQSPRKT
jgi:hypothetical protein